MSTTATVEKLHNEKLWVISVLDKSRAGVDAWEAYVRQYMAAIQTSERYLVYDTTGILNLGFTNYLQQRATALAKDNRDASGRVAIVIDLAPTIRYFFETFVNITGQRIQPKLSVKFFGKQTEAIAWVEEILPSTT